MKQYLDLLAKIYADGEDRPDRTGTGTRSLFGQQIRMDLAAGFPLLTTKKVNFKAVVHELLWFLRGETNIKSLNAVGVHIWDEWADENGELGPVYGKQWRQWEAWNYFGNPKDSPKEFELEPIDQIACVVKSIKENPYSRRHIVSAWNPAEVNKMALPPCHTMFQFYVSVSGRLSCHLYARSIDAFLGLPFNIASYALLTRIVAFLTECSIGDLVISFGDVHIYKNHFDQVNIQLSRKPRRLPVLFVNPLRDGGTMPAIDQFRIEDFQLNDYDPWPAIKAEISV